MNYTAIVIEAEREGEYGGHAVSMNKIPIYYRPYDGSDNEEVVREAIEGLGELLREKLTWPKDQPEGDWF